LLSIIGGAAIVLLFLFWLMPRRKTMAASLEGEPPGEANHPTGADR
jgi:hypothetical protein